MKFVLTSRVNNLNGCTLPLGVASTQEIHLSNSRATIKTLRAVIAIKFKLPPMSFDMVYMGPKTDVQWSDETNVIEASGLEDGDRMWVIPKDVNLSDVLKSDAAEEQNKKETISHSKPTIQTTTTAASNETVQKEERVDRTSPPLKVFRTESSAVSDEQISQGTQNTTCIDAQNIINNKANPTATLTSKTTTTETQKVETNTEKANTENNQITEDDKRKSSTNANESQKEEMSVNKNNIYNDNVNVNDNDDVVADAELDKDNEDDEEEEEMEENGPDELYERLMEVTPNLMEMREEFLAHPEEVMQRIHKEDPKLFSLITANQESFVELVNNADFVRALQDEKEAYEIDWSNDDDMEYGEFDDDNDDDDDGINAEMNDAAVEAMHNLYLQLLAGDNARAMQHSGARSEEIGMQNNVESSSHTGNNEGIASNNKEHDNNNNNNTSRNEQDTSQATSDNNNTPNNSTQIAGQINTTRNFVPLQQAQISDILAYAPSEEDMRKIEGLTELGFTFNQCKVAFYSCRRSLERAANFLFESPPKL